MCLSMQEKLSENFSLKMVRNAELFSVVLEQNLETVQQLGIPYRDIYSTKITIS